MPPQVNVNEEKVAGKRRNRTRNVRYWLVYIQRHPHRACWMHLRTSVKEHERLCTFLWLGDSSFVLRRHRRDVVARLEPALYVARALLACLQQDRCAFSVTTPLTDGNARSSDARLLLSLSVDTKNFVLPFHWGRTSGLRSA